eukprot:TRINITY_DN4823_c0_g1_i1.p1 TRINITY_DN4823_c0_g1~~TRINITY_DN4823_c0_g1_i1.p1  ORF type:complete len:957 (+),score=96.30 TRINITY_DN4823_c0_g1_i1:69-2939(+)
MRSSSLRLLLLAGCALVLLGIMLTLGKVQSRSLHNCSPTSPVGVFAEQAKAAGLFSKHNGMVEAQSREAYAGLALRRETNTHTGANGPRMPAAGRASSPVMLVGTNPEVLDFVKYAMTRAISSSCAGEWGVVDRALERLFDRRTPGAPWDPRLIEQAIGDGVVGGLGHLAEWLKNTDSEEHQEGTVSALQWAVAVVEDPRAVGLECRLRQKQKEIPLGADTAEYNEKSGKGDASLQGNACVEMMRDYGDAWVGLESAVATFLPVFLRELKSALPLQDPGKVTHEQDQQAMEMWRRMSLNATRRVAPVYSHRHRIGCRGLRCVVMLDAHDLLQWPESAAWFLWRHVRSSWSFERILELNAGRRDRKNQGTDDDHSDEELLRLEEEGSALGVTLFAAKCSTRSDDGLYLNGLGGERDEVLATAAESMQRALKRSLGTARDGRYGKWEDEFTRLELATVCDKYNERIQKDTVEHPVTEMKRNAAAFGVGPIEGPHEHGHQWKGAFERPKSLRDDKVAAVAWEMNVLDARHGAMQSETPQLGMMQRGANRLNGAGGPFRWDADRENVVGERQRGIFGDDAAEVRLRPEEISVDAGLEARRRWMVERRLMVAPERCVWGGFIFPDTSTLKGKARNYDNMFTKLATSAHMYGGELARMRLIVHVVVPHGMSPAHSTLRDMARGVETTCMSLALNASVHFKNMPSWYVETSSGNLGKLMWLADPLVQQADVALFMDLDLFVMGDPVPYFSPRHVREALADSKDKGWKALEGDADEWTSRHVQPDWAEYVTVESVSEPKVFEHMGRHFPSSTDDDPRRQLLYCNSGVFYAPRGASAHWINLTWMLVRIQMRSQHLRMHRDQFVLTVAHAAMLPPFQLLPITLNYPISFTEAACKLRFPVKILHYHYQPARALQTIRQNRLNCPLAFALEDRFTTLEDAFRKSEDGGRGSSPSRAIAIGARSFPL